MKIVHACLSNVYVENRAYQENQIVACHVAAGHEVTVLASTEIHNTKNTYEYTEPCDRIGSDGARLIRVPYRWRRLHRLAVKIRAYRGVYALLEQIRPDIIMFHGSSAWELRNIIYYARKNSHVTVYIDSHADAVNSAQGWISREILHRRFYGPILRRAIAETGPLLCVSISAMDFAREVYGIPCDRMEFYPLGGNVPSDVDRVAMRTACRQQLGLHDSDIVVIQTGKMGKAKKIHETLEAFAKIERDDIRLLIAGTFGDDIRDMAEDLVAKDPRVIMLGWQSPEALTTLLCASDIYLQPGTQSSTMQHAICCGCNIILDDIASHRPYHDDNGWLIRTTDEIIEILAAVDREGVELRRRRSLSYARQHLDYAQLTRRVTG